ncbi:hypothetical protein ACIP97_11860 [Peribacillus frigoritolerans]|uniref:hypothetical protein n=1 Tax=Peribacillus frigoritolerans TaxID=450367 RepID=UPI003828B258
MFETPAGKASPGETPQAQGAERAPGPPAESECLEFSKELWTSFNTKLIGAGVQEPCGKSVPKNTKIAQFSNHVNHQIVILFFHFKGFYHLP